MIERLKIMLDEAETKSPQVKLILLKIAALKEKNQEDALKLVELMLERRAG